MSPSCHSPHTQSVLRTRGHGYVSTFSPSIYTSYQVNHGLLYAPMYLRRVYSLVPSKTVESNTMKTNNIGSRSGGMQTQVCKKPAQDAENVRKEFMSREKRNRYNAPYRDGSCADTEKKSEIGSTGRVSMVSEKIVSMLTRTLQR